MLGRAKRDNSFSMSLLHVVAVIDHGLVHGSVERGSGDTM
jgi:hypothetical protein